MPAKKLDSAALDQAAGTEAADIEVQRKEALLEKGALQSAIFNSANFSSIATDAKGVIQIFNVGAERMLGYTAAEVMNKITPADISDPQEVIARAKALSVELGTPITPGFEALVFKASRGIEDIYELTYIRKDGSRFPAVVSVTALRDAQDAIIGYLLIGTDNTARKQAEDALREIEVRDKARIALEQTYRMRSDFMANVTHELRTPLNSVIGFAELLKDEVPGPLNPKQAQFATDILASGQRLLALVEGILEMSRLDAAGAALEREPVEIGAILEERVAAHRKATEARGVTMRLGVAPEAGSAELDPKALRRIVDALLDNAIKFNREGGAVAVSARRDNGWLKIAVADTGIGIAHKDLEKLFKPLAQLDAGLARRHSGVGLGLALARRLAELHGGTIEVESESGKGSTFTLRFPIQEKS